MSNDVVKELLDNKKRLENEVGIEDTAFDNMIMIYLKTNPLEQKNMAYYEIEIARCDHETRILDLERELEITRIKLYNARRLRRASKSQLDLEEYAQDEALNAERLEYIDVLTEFKKIELAVRKRTLTIDKYNYEMTMDKNMDADEIVSVEYQIGLLKEENAIASAKLKELATKINGFKEEVKVTRHI